MSILLASKRKVTSNSRKRGCMISAQRNLRLVILLITTSFVSLCGCIHEKLIKKLEVVPVFPVFSGSGADHEIWFTLWAPCKDKHGSYYESSTISRELKWQLLIKDYEGMVVRTMSGDQKPSYLSWNGRDDNGHLVIDGPYYYGFSVRDKFGHEYHSTGILCHVRTISSPH